MPGFIIHMSMGDPNKLDPNNKPKVLVAGHWHKQSF